MLILFCSKVQKSTGQIQKKAIKRMVKFDAIKRKGQNRDVKYGTFTAGETIYR
tara:strand:- start:3604 stop:3762 length:159 start_codon:yes stop_codon:yes gene_type:complete